MQNYSTDMFTAFFANSKAAASSLQTINDEMIAFGKSRFDGGIEALNAMLAAETVKDALAVQADYMKTTIESYVAESAKLGEMTSKLASEAVGSFVKPIAA